jgi:uncharacterized protein (TIGR02145 family)
MRKRKNFLFNFYIMLNIAAFGQIGVNTSSPNSNAAFDIRKNNNAIGVRLPEIKQTDRNDAISRLDTTAQGLIVFDPNKNNYWYWEGIKWKELDALSNYFYELGIDNREVAKKLALLLNLVVYDNDGNPIPTIDIGTQLWMKTNLNVTKFNDGNSINSNYYSSTSKYKQYSYEAVYWGSGLCPLGWRIASQADWIKFFNYMGPDIKMPDMWSGSCVEGKDSLGIYQIGPTWKSNMYINTPSGYSNVSYKYAIWSAENFETISIIGCGSTVTSIVTQDNILYHYGGVYSAIGIIKLAVRCVKDK